jgi:hypothetical protein
VKFVGVSLDPMAVNRGPQLLCASERSAARDGDGAARDGRPYRADLSVA